MDTMLELPPPRQAADAAYSMIGTRSVRAAELAPNTADADSRTVEVVWSAGARVRRATFFGEPYDEELSLDPANVRLDRLNAGARFHLQVLGTGRLPSWDTLEFTVTHDSEKKQRGVMRSRLGAKMFMIRPAPAKLDDAQERHGATGAGGKDA